MDRTERFHLIDQMLCNQRIVTRAQFLQALEVSPATFKRDLEYLRDRLAAPIVWDPELRGYRYEAGAELEQFQLPGLWFNTSEIQALPRRRPPPKRARHRAPIPTNFCVSRR